MKCMYKMYEKIQIHGDRCLLSSCCPAVFGLKAGHMLNMSPVHCTVTQRHMEKENCLHIFNVKSLVSPIYMFLERGVGTKLPMDMCIICNYALSLWE